MVDKRHILVVDDDAAVRAYIRAVLEEANYDVTEAEDGRLAVQQAAAHPVDVIITDLVMPEQEGIETIRILRRELPSVKIIAVSGAFGGKVLGAARLLGAHATLPKPLEPEVLLKAVGSLLSD